MSKLLTASEAMEVSGATRPTIITWARYYTVDGKPLGYKRGGRWVIRSEQFILFLQGGGRRLTDGKEIKAPIINKHRKKKKRRGAPLK